MRGPGGLFAPLLEAVCNGPLDADAALDAGAALDAAAFNVNVTFAAAFAAAFAGGFGGAGGGAGFPVAVNAGGGAGFPVAVNAGGASPCRALARRSLRFMACSAVFIVATLALGGALPRSLIVVRPFGGRMPVGSVLGGGMLGSLAGCDMPVVSVSVCWFTSLSPGEFISVSAGDI